MVKLDAFAEGIIFVVFILLFKWDKCSKCFPLQYEYIENRSDPVSAVARTVLYVSERAEFGWCV